MTPLAFVVITLAVARVTRAVTTDDVSLSFRERIESRGRARSASYPPSTPWYVTFTECDWCVSFWLALIAAAIGKATGLIDSWTWATWCWPAMAAGAGMTLRWQ
jgi:hypothetical protein